ncbi:MAG: hypothetical protein KDI61_01715 [Alphaproteobacteria bacterium]|nr:hypothetical protein [Alphaproteobacteria bacterium]
MSASISPWTASGMKDKNRSLEAPVREFLEQIVREPSRHALFMNMLSMLEHMGSRKIMLSQMNRVLTEDTLSHLSEEARHAYFFKRHAERIGGEKLDGFTEENTLCRVPALMYFGRLDAGITKEVGEEAAYPWVSLVIELRACWLYEIYQDVLERSGVALSLTALLAEEDQHLADMFAQCGAQYDLLKKLSAYETGLFVKFWDQLKGEQSLKKAA